MATQVVELTGDEAKLLRSLQAIINKEEQHRQKLMDVGKAGEQTGGKIEGSMGKAAKANDKIRDGLTKIERDGINSFESLGTTAAKQFTGLLLGFASVGQAVQLVTGYMKEQEEVLKRALDKNLSLSQAQQAAIKNLSGLSLSDQQYLLTAAPAEISRTSGFANQIEITDAISQVASTGLTDANQIANVVRETARIQKDESLDVVAAAAAQIQSKTGLKDIREAIGLVTSTGSTSLVGDFGKLLTALPKALTPAVSSAPNQDKLEAARQGAAIYSQVTQFGADKEGQSSATFTSAFLSRLGTFFTEIENERIDARSRIQTINNKKLITEADIRDRKELGEFVAASEGLKDPGKIFERLQALQASEPLSRQFKGEGFGEEQFRATLGFLLNKDSDLSKTLFGSGYDQIQADVGKFEDMARNLARYTPQLALSLGNERIDAAIGALQAENVGGALTGLIREKLPEVLKETRTEGTVGFFQSLKEPFIKTLGLSGVTPAEEAVTAIQSLLERRQDIGLQGVKEDELPRVRAVDATIRAIMDLLGDIDGPSGFTPAALTRAQTLVNTTTKASGSLPEEFAKEQILLARELLEIMDGLRISQEIATQAAKETAANTAPGTPNYGAIQRGAR